jgi:NADPH:quinone reductase-like Zn-dependent oxidoreductase/short-subunit dehydrogenase/acyl carrier protein
LAQTAATEQTLVESAPSPARNWVVLADVDGYSDKFSRLLSKQLETNGDRVICVSPGNELQALTEKRYHLDPRNPAHIETLLLEAGSAFGQINGILHLHGLNKSPADKETDAVLAQQIDRCAIAAAIIQACESTNTTATCWLLTARTSKTLLSGHQQIPQTFHIEDTIDAPLRGFGRTLMNEASNFAIRLIDLAEPDAVECIVSALERELRYPDAELEIALSATGERFVPRLRIEAQAGAQVAPAGKPASNIARLGFQLPGQLRGLRWESHPRIPPAEDEIEIDVQATGLNFRDVMYALGMLSDETVENGFAGPTLGVELSGIVASVGAKVEGLAPGDKVVAFGPACFGNQVITKAAATALMPPGISFEAAATIPTTFFTAYYALHHLARLQEGEKVLIHGAAGGVGIAAIQIAKWRGAEIFASAGSEEKRDFLKLLGVDHILDSRSLAFADKILALTGGEGIDVVLNSLAGEAINRNFQVLKHFGRFLELGKRDFYENTKIGLRPLRNNISYFGIDADQLMQTRPDLAQKLFREVMALFSEGVLHPLPYHIFDAAEIVDAFRYMQQSRHIGKIVITYRNGIAAQHFPSQMKRQLELPTAATYLVTGGTSGFGLKTAQWLADKGARHLVLISRSGPVAPEAQAAIVALQARGVKVHAVSCDVTDKEALSALLQEITTTMPPLRGLVHAASVIEDALIRNMNRDQIHHVLAPKILGAQYLHQLTGGLELDFFILFSSATTLFGNPGQGNYVAANTYLEALAESRRAAGLPALCVRWGPIGDVGFLARNEQIKEALQSRMGGAALISDIALDALESMLLEDRSGLAVLELDWKTLSRFLPTAHAPRFSELSRVAESANIEGDDVENIQRLLTELSKEELTATFIKMLKTEVGEILRISPEKIDENKSIYDLGLDSLMGVELVTAIECRFGVSIPTLALSESPTIAKLAEKIIAQLTNADDKDETAQAIEMRSKVEQIASQHAAEVPQETVDQVTHAIQTSDLTTTTRMIR